MSTLFDLPKLALGVVSLIDLLTVRVPPLNDNRLLQHLSYTDNVITLC